MEIETKNESGSPETVASNPANPAPPSNVDASKEVPANNPPAAPEGLDAAFWDAEKGSIKVDALNGRLAELETIRAQHDMLVKGLPENAEGYKMALPEGVAVPEGFAIDESRPEVVELRAWAAKNKVSQAALSEALAIDLKRQVAERTEIETRVAAEQAKLGPDKGAARVAAVDAFLTERVGAEQAKHLRAMIVTADQVKALETLMRSVANQGGGRTDGYKPAAGGKGGEMTEEEWSRLSAVEKFRVSK